MSYAKYYDNLFVDGKINSKFVTYLSAIHMANVLAKRDKVTNDILNDLCSNYSLKASSFFDGANSPLTFMDDDIQIIYDFTKEHIDKILKNPHQSIVKEQQLINKEKLKQIEPKTLNWLANKPGSTIKEKLANVSKVSSTVKKYTYNIKENQLFLAYFKDIYKLLNNKISIIKNNPELFGDQTEKVDELTHKLNKTRFTIKNDFDEVIEKDFSTPNNALIGNVDYSSIWKSYLNVKQGSLDYENAFDLYKKSFYQMFISCLMNKYDFVEDNLSENELNKTVLYWIENDSLIEILFKNDDSLDFVINEYKIEDKVTLSVAKEIKVELNLTEQESNRGLTFTSYLNGENVGTFYADILGFKEIFNVISDKLALKKNDKLIQAKEKQGYLFASINAFDNKVSSADATTSLSISNQNTIYENKKIYFANKNNCSLNTYKSNSYANYLRLLSTQQDFSKNSILIYDIKDTYDEFSSVNLRRAFSSAYPQSYPVWRSILAGESVKSKEEVKTVIDLCGNPESISISKLERKNDRFVHCGAIETPLYYEKFTEGDFYKCYLNKYQEKYSMQFTDEVIKEFITGGKLSNVLTNKESEILLNGNYDNHDYFLISFDEEIFKEVLFDFESSLKAIMNREDNKSTIFIVPNFANGLTSKYPNVLCNSNLLTGAKEIIDRIKKSEITWYEKLPKLSLEIIKNGMFDNLVLVDNQECENIIGKSFKIEVPETLTLSKGEENYILPLNKSFIGEENESFVAKAEDKSFPLADDLNVKLTIEYKFGSENSYILKLKPISNDGPFEELEVKWEKETQIEKFYSPTIYDNILSNNDIKKEVEEQIPSYINSLEKNISAINRGQYSFVTRQGKTIDNWKSARRNLQVLANKKQRLFATNKFTIQDLNKIFDGSLISKLKFLIDHYKEDNDGPLDYLKKMINLDDTYVGLSLDRNLFLDKRLHFNYGCYGRYLNAYPNDKEVIEMAYSDLLSIISEKDYLSKRKIRIFMEKFTAVAVGNHLAIKEISKVNNRFVHLLMKTITEVLKDLCEFDWNQEDVDEAYGNNPSENAYLMRHCYELLICLLYCRDDIAFEGLRPSGMYSKQLLYYIKKLNLIFKTKINLDFHKNLKTKYVLNIDLPEKLKNTWNIAYILILCLSGDERANHIEIKAEEER